MAASEQYVAPHQLVAPAADDLRARVPAPRRFDGRFAAGLVLAVALHAVAFAASTYPLERVLTGAGGQSPDAISVELSAMPSTGSWALPSVAAPDAAAPGETAPEATLTTASIEPPQQPSKAEDAVSTEPDPPLIAIKPDPSPPTDAPVLSVAEPPRGTPDTEPLQKPERLKPVVATASPSEAGVAPTVASPPSPGAARPSAAEMRAYANAISTALRGTPPDPVVGAAGTVHVEFRIGEDGAYAFVRVVESSGRRDLDEATVIAVRRVKMPPPPRGMTDKERTYAMPYFY